MAFTFANINWSEKQKAAQKGENLCEYYLGCYQVRMLSVLLRLNTSHEDAPCVSGQSHWITTCKSLTSLKVEVPLVMINPVPFCSDYLKN